MAKKKFPDIQTKFDVKEFKQNLDACNFNDRAFMLKKVGKEYFLIVLHVDLDTGIAVVKSKKSVSKTREVAFRTLEEINFRVNEDLPLTAKQKKLLGIEEETDDKED